jgi:release factor glutamine methyltransferase
MTNNIPDLLRTTARQLERAGIDTARLDAELLLAHCLTLSRSTLLTQARTLTLTDSIVAQFQALIARRLQHEPVAYLTGMQEFWSLPFEVGPGVLIPRPDSETLIEAAIKKCSVKKSLRVLDLGTGPGTLLLTLLHEFPAATGLGVDCSEIALGYARRNAAHLHLADRAQFQQGDWLQGITEHFDLIVCNPPYIARDAQATLMPDVVNHEPHLALFADQDGLAVYEQLIPQLASVLTASGIVLFETGATQARDVAHLAAKSGFSCQIVPDLGGRERCVLLEQQNA